MPKRFRVYFAPLAAAALLGGLFYSTAPWAIQVRKISLPLGDGHIAFQPARDNIFVCDSQFAAGGAFRDGPWIAKPVWYPDGKVWVEGEVAWQGAQFTQRAQGGWRVLHGNGLPVNQKTGVFPVEPDSQAYAYDRNPNRILPQPLVLRLPLAPKVAAKPGCVPMGLIGMTRTGVAIYNGLDATGRDAAAHEVQDRCGGHPERNGQYHIHHWTGCLPDAAGEKGGHSDLAGYMLDGFGIYGPVGEGGKRLSNADLDACHGHTHTVLWDGKMQAMYHYHFTDEYPYTIGCFAGMPIALQPSQSAAPQGLWPPPPQVRKR